ncbi:unnamed protein product [Nesidiocoris tenuis]|uniref:Uncharacterized protein n=1 Tax=Nesidiocoris tenuis TaxID=355587 RepID=A0A6H5HPA4_9HEMI|nr:unnamed protein product [Nesidiocoris tenuis]
MNGLRVSFIRVPCLFVLLNESDGVDYVMNPFHFLTTVLPNVNVFWSKTSEQLLLDEGVPRQCPRLAASSGLKDSGMKSRSRSVPSLSDSAIPYLTLSAAAGAAPSTAVPGGPCRGLFQEHPFVSAFTLIPEQALVKRWVTELRRFWNRGML